MDIKMMCTSIEVEEDMFRYGFEGTAPNRIIGVSILHREREIWIVGFSYNLGDLI